MALFMAGRHLWESAQGGRVGVGRRDNRQRRQPGRAAGNSRQGLDVRAQVFWWTSCACASELEVNCPVDHFRRPRAKAAIQPSLYS